MIFRNPWAWLGLLGIAGPIAAHLLARRPARRQAFPNLRFLPPASVRPVRLASVADVALLAVRIATVVTAVAALAQPLWLSPERTHALGSQLARAIVMDTGASADGAVARPLREAAAREADGATVSRVAASAAPGAALASAVTWLDAQPMRREVVVVSDLAHGALTRADVDGVPAHIGVRMVHVADAASGAGASATTRTGAPIVLLTGAAERAAAEAARDAAIATGAPATGRADRPVAIVFPGAEERAALLKTAGELTEPWMFDVLAAITDDPLVRETGALMEPRAFRPGENPGSKDPGLHLILHTPAHDIATAAIVAAAMRAIAPAPPIDRHTTPAPSPAEVLAWQRAPSPVPITNAAEAGDLSDARWVWLLVLAWLAIETVARRRRPAAIATDTEVPRARVA